METSNMKNMVVFKNLPSNMVEEAIIIFKENQKVKEKEFIENGTKNNYTQMHSKSKDFVIKEAEMLVKDYINKIENTDSVKKSKKNKNDTNLKYYSIVISIFFVISLIINFI